MILPGDHPNQTNIKDDNDRTGIVRNAVAFTVAIIIYVDLYSNRPIEAPRPRQTPWPQGWRSSFRQGEGHGIKMAIVMLLPGLWTAMTQVLSEQGQSAQIVVGARGGCKGKSAETRARVTAQK